MRPAEKRLGSDAFGSSQLVVKRQKSDANIGGRNAVAVVNSTAQNGALIQSVRLVTFAVPITIMRAELLRKQQTDEMGQIRFFGRVACRRLSWSSPVWMLGICGTIESDLIV